MAGLPSDISGRPLWLLAELTYRCPLQCPYCSNPVDFARRQEELSTADWMRVLGEARQLGAMQLGFSGGEPLLRHDLEELVAEARRLGYYSNLITSGVGMNEERVARFKQAGLDHIQVSFQDSREDAANWIAGAKAHAHKIELSRAIRKHKIAFTVNLVVHRQNLDHLEEMIAFIAPASRM